jgi:thiamine-monophosphate kinase
VTGEFALIDAFLAPFGLDRTALSSYGSGVRAGPGDDCAQLVPTRGQVLVATTDAVLDGVHFDLRRCTPEDAGWKALAVNLSDLAAAGATPRWILCALGVPRGPDSVRTAARMGAGMADLLSRTGGALVGGNVTRSPVWSLTITALGEAKRPLTRAGGRPGDALVLVGTLGAAALALRRLQVRPAKSASGQGARRATGIVAAQTRPWPQLAAGLAAGGLASAAIDVSDGLLQDAGHLCKRSGCGAVLDCALFPRLPEVAAAERTGARGGAHPYALSLGGGEEYALLLAVAPRKERRLLAALAKVGSPGVRVGRLEAGSAVRLVEGEQQLPLPARAGFDHLASAAPGVGSQERRARR